MRAILAVALLTGLAFGQQPTPIPTGGYSTKPLRPDPIRPAAGEEKQTSQFPKKGVALPVGTVFSLSSIAEDMLGKTVKFKDKTEWLFCHGRSETTEVTSIKKITIVSDTVRLEVEVKAHLC